MGPFSFLYIHRKSCLWILIYFLLAFIPSAWFIFSNNRQYVIDNWAYLKTKPLYAPFAGFVRKKPGQSVIEAGIKNILASLWAQIKIMFNLLMKPFRFIIGLVHTIIKSFASIMDVFRQQMAVIRKFLQNIIQSVMKRLEDLAATFINIFLRLRDMMNRGFATFRMITYLLQTFSYTMKSMLGGPVGTMMRFSGNFGYIATFFLLGPFSFAAFPSLWHCLFCFGGQTPIQLDDGTTREIAKVNLGDQTLGGSVTGVLVFQQDRPCPVFQRDGDIVTGSHPVSDGKRWIDVAQHPGYQPVDFRGPLYCLVTTNHRITTPSATYLDWDETSSQDTYYQLKLKAVRALNTSDTTISVHPNHVYQEGFSRPDYLAKEKTVTGTGIWLSDSEVTWYVAGNSVDSPQVTGSTLVQYQGHWHQVCQDPRFRPVIPQPKHQHIYHVKTRTGTVLLDGICFRDLMEHPDLV